MISTDSPESPILHWLSRINNSKPEPRPNQRKPLIYYYYYYYIYDTYANPVRSERNRRNWVDFAWLNGFSHMCWVSNIRRNWSIKLMELKAIIEGFWSLWSQIFGRRFTHVGRIRVGLSILLILLVGRFIVPNFFSSFNYHLTILILTLWKSSYNDIFSIFLIPYLRSPT